MNIRLTEAEIHAASMACRTTVGSRVPTDKNSVPTDSGAFRSQFCGREIVNAVLIVGGVALGGLIHKPTNTL